MTKDIRLGGGRYNTCSAYIKKHVKIETKTYFWPLFSESEFENDRIVTCQIFYDSHEDVIRIVAFQKIRYNLKSGRQRSQKFDTDGETDEGGHGTVRDGGRKEDGHLKPKEARMSRHERRAQRYDSLTLLFWSSTCTLSSSTTLSCSRVKGCSGSFKCRMRSNTSLPSNGSRTEASSSVSSTTRLSSVS